MWDRERPVRKKRVCMCVCACGVHGQGVCMWVVCVKCVEDVRVGCVGYVGGMYIL